MASLADVSKPQWSLMALLDAAAHKGDGSLWTVEAATCFGILVAIYTCLFMLYKGRQKKVLHSPVYGKPGDASFGQALSTGYKKVRQ